MTALPVFFGCEAARSDRRDEFFSALSKNPPGEDFTGFRRALLKKAHAMVLLASAGYIHSPHHQDELQGVLLREREGVPLIIIPEPPVLFEVSLLCSVGAPERKRCPLPTNGDWIEVINELEDVQKLRRNLWSGVSEKKKKLLILHASEDRHHASSLIKHLAVLGRTLEWKSPDNVLPGSSADETIRRGVTNADGVVLLESASLYSEKCTRWIKNLDLTGKIYLIRVVSCISDEELLRMVNTIVKQPISSENDQDSAWTEAVAKLMVNLDAQ